MEGNEGPATRDPKPGQQNMWLAANGDMFVCASDVDEREEK